jgi:hypothetical protein
MTLIRVTQSSTNPGPPGFARFWGRRFSLFSDIPGTGVDTLQDGGTEVVSSKKLPFNGPRLALRLPSSASRVDTSESFFEETFQVASFGHLSKAQKAHDKEGTYMPGTQ